MTREQMDELKSEMKEIKEMVERLRQDIKMMKLNQQQQFLMQPR